MINVLIYAASVDMDGMDGKYLKKLLKTLAVKNQPEIYFAIETLIERLRKPLGQNFIGILIPGDQRELSNLITIRHLFRDMRIILVLPDNEEATVSRGHYLRPRFLTYADSNFSDVIAVMDNMMTHMRKAQL